MSDKTNNLYITDEIKFNDDTPNKLLENRSFLNWPVVYLIYNDKEIYVGETVNVCNRMRQHLTNAERRKLDNLRVIYDRDFTKSATLDIEASLIGLMDSDNQISKKRILQNGTGGLNRHKYANAAEFSQDSVLFNKLWKKLNDCRLVHNELQALKNSEIFKYSPYKALDPGQINARNIALSYIGLSCKEGKINKSFVIKGGAGTGKSILGIYLMKLLTSYQQQKDFYNEYSEDDIEKAEIPEYFKYLDMIYKYYGRQLKIGYVVAMNSFRTTVGNTFKNKNNKGLLKKMALSPYDVTKKHYDILIVDEAHRLKQNVNLGRDVGAYKQSCERLGLDTTSNQLDWILKNSDFQIFFYDDTQTIKPTDVPKECFDRLINNLERTETYPLFTQMRIMANGDYIGYAKRVLNCTQNDPVYFENDYDFYLVDKINDLVNIIQDKEDKFELSRMVAGFSWPWKNSAIVYDDKVKNKKVHKDIEIESRKFYWNLSNTDWVEKSKGKEVSEEIGCIHTIQGYDLNYCGVIFGKEIDYDINTNKIIIYKDLYYDSNGKDSINDDEILKEYIINIYSVLMTRGIRGTYVYAYNKGLRDYLNKYIKKYNS